MPDCHRLCPAVLIQIAAHGRGDDHLIMSSKFVSCRLACPGKRRMRRVAYPVSRQRGCNPERHSRISAPWHTGVQRGTAKVKKKTDGARSAQEIRAPRFVDHVGRRRSRGRDCPEFRVLARSSTSSRRMSRSRPRMGSATRHSSARRTAPSGCASLAGRLRPPAVHAGDGKAPGCRGLFGSGSEPFYRISKAPFTDASKFSFQNPDDMAKLRPLMGSVNAPGIRRRTRPPTSRFWMPRKRSTSPGRSERQGYCMGGPWSFALLRRCPIASEPARRSWRRPCHRQTRKAPPAGAEG